MARKKVLKNPLSEADKALFDDEMRKWQVWLNLSNWRVIKSDRKTNAMSEMFDWDTPNRMARYKIGDDYGVTKVTPHTIEGTAIHEMLHLLLHEPLEVACAEGEYNDTVMGAEHSAIAVLENLLLELSIRRREAQELLTAIRAGDTVSQSNTAQEEHADQAHVAGQDATSGSSGS